MFIILQSKRSIEQGLTNVDSRSFNSIKKKSKIVNRCSLFFNRTNAQQGIN